VSVVDTPDGQYGTVNPQQQLAYFPDATGPETITLPPNAETILIFQNEVFSNVLNSIQGVTSGCHYSWNQLPVGPPGGNPIYVVNVVPAMDDQLIITWQSYGSGISYYVVADSGIRQTLDVYLQFVLGIVNEDVPTSALLVGGSDGADLRALQTDSNGRLVPLVPTDTSPMGMAVGPTTFVGAPTSGAWYLFGVDITTTGAGVGQIYFITGGGTWICVASIAGPGTISIPLQGMRVTSSVILNGINTAGTCVLRYAPGP
jgi:hypothetical protein